MAQEIYQQEIEFLVQVVRAVDDSTPFVESMTEEERGDRVRELLDRQGADMAAMMFAILKESPPSIISDWHLREALMMTVASLLTRNPERYALELERLGSEPEIRSILLDAISQRPGLKRVPGSFMRYLSKIAPAVSPLEEDYDALIVCLSWQESPEALPVLERMRKNIPVGETNFGLEYAISSLRDYLSTQIL